MGQSGIYPSSFGKLLTEGYTPQIEERIFTTEFAEGTEKRKKRRSRWGLRGLRRREMCRRGRFESFRWRGRRWHWRMWMDSSTRSITFAFTGEGRWRMVRWKGRL